MAKKTALFVVAVLAPATVFAQAWVPRAGDGTVAFVYQNQLVRDHLFSDGARIDAGHIKSNGVLLDFTYGITDRLALNVNVPYTASAYHGSNPHPGSLLDDGKTHGTLQDFRANFRYNLMNKGIVLTPFVDVIVPSHRYDYFGHAAPGRRLAEAQIGTYVGHVLTSGLPGAFVPARVSYGFSQLSKAARDPAFDPIRKDPRFSTIVPRFGVFKQSAAQGRGYPVVSVVPTSDQTRNVIDTDPKARTSSIGRRVVFCAGTSTCRSRQRRSTRSTCSCAHRARL
jgi:hypothetical protein